MCNTRATRSLNFLEGEIYNLIITWEREPVPHQMCGSYTKYTSWYSAWSISQMAPGLKYKTIWKWCKCNPLYLYEDTDNVHSAPGCIKVLPWGLIYILFFSTEICIPTELGFSNWAGSQEICLHITIENSEDTKKSIFYRKVLGIFTLGNNYYLV